MLQRSNKAEEILKEKENLIKEDFRRITEEEVLLDNVKYDYINKSDSSIKILKIYN